MTTQTAAEYHLPALKLYIRLHLNHLSSIQYHLIESTIFLIDFQSITIEFSH